MHTDAVCVCACVCCLVHPSQCHMLVSFPSPFQSTCVSVRIGHGKKSKSECCVHDACLLARVWACVCARLLAKPGAIEMEKVSLGCSSACTIKPKNPPPPYSLRDGSSGQPGRRDEERAAPRLVHKGRWIDPLFGPRAPSDSLIPALNNVAVCLMKK